jgi:hypothetical protein
VEKKTNSLALVKLFAGTLEEVEENLCVFYRQKNFTLEEAKENTKAFGNFIAVFYTEKNPAG